MNVRGFCPSCWGFPILQRINFLNEYFELQDGRGVGGGGGGGEGGLGGARGKGERERCTWITKGHQKCGFGVI